MPSPQPHLDNRLSDLKLQYVTDSAGAVTAVILPIESLETLLEDLDDLAVIAERREEAVVSHDEVVAELRRDGLL